MKRRKVPTYDEALEHLGSERRGSHLQFPKFESYRDDFDIALAAVKSQGAALQYVSPRLKGVPEIVGAALQSNLTSGQYLKVADDVCKADYKLVRLAMKHSDQHNAGAALQHASDGIRGDKKFLEEVMDIYGCKVILWAANELKRNEELLLKAIKAGLSYELFEDCDILKESLEKRPIMEALVHERAYALVLATKTRSGAWAANDYKIVMAAVQNRSKINRTALEFASAGLKADTDIVMAAVQSDGMALECACTALQARMDIVKAAVQSDGGALQFASSELQGHMEIVKIAVESDGTALEFASTGLKDCMDIVKIAVQSDGMALKFASANLKADMDIVMAAVENDGTALQFASESLRCTPEVVLKAANTSDSVLQCDDDRIAVPREFQLSHPDVVEAVVRKKASALKYATPEHKKIEQIVHAALFADGDALQYADPELQNKEATVILAVLKARTAGVLYMANERLREKPEVVFAAVTKKGSALRHAKGKLKNDKNIVLQAVSENPNAYIYASANLKRDPDVLNAAIHTNELQRQIAQYGPAAILRKLDKVDDDDSGNQEGEDRVDDEADDTAEDDEDDDTAGMDDRYRDAHKAVLDNIAQCSDAKGRIRQHTKKSKRLVEKIEGIGSLVHTMERQLVHREGLEKLAKVLGEAHTLLQGQFRRSDYLTKWWTSRDVESKFGDIEARLDNRVRDLTLPVSVINSGEDDDDGDVQNQRDSAESDEAVLSWLQKNYGEQAGQIAFDQAKAVKEQREQDKKKERERNLEWAESVMFRLQQKHKEEVAAAEIKGLTLQQALDAKEDELREAFKKSHQNVNSFKARKLQKAADMFNIAHEAEQKGGMRRDTYAKRLKAVGLPLDGQNVFHIIANSNGGADHPDNYLYALGSTFNQSIGDKYDDFNCFLAGREQAAKAVAVSAKYGTALDLRDKPLKKYKFQSGSSDPDDEARYLFGRGQALLKAMRVDVRSNSR